LLQCLIFLEENAQEQENAGNLKQKLAKLFQLSLEATVPGEPDIEPLVAACTAKFGDYQWYYKHYSRIILLL
jgi:hypothetical protein